MRPFVLNSHTSMNSFVRRVKKLLSHAARCPGTMLQTCKIDELTTITNRRFASAAFIKAIWNFEPAQYLRCGILLDQSHLCIHELKIKFMIV